MDPQRIYQVNRCLTKMMKNVRKEYEQKLLHTIKTNPKILYRHVSSNKKVKEYIGELQTSNYTYISNALETASKLNLIFKSIFTKEDDLTELIFSESIPQLLEKETSEQFILNTSTNNFKIENLHIDSRT